MSQNRTITTACGDYIKGRPIQGCPQEGVLSPLLWCLMVDDLLEKLKSDEFSVHSYANDVAIMVR